MGGSGLSNGVTGLRSFTLALLTSKYVALALRLYLGGVFIYASMYKIGYPIEFAENIASYQIVPFWAVNLVAIVMPWTELICGILLVVGLRSKSAASMIAGMLALFSIAIFLSLVRDIPIGCGCFQSVEEPMTWRTLGRDLIWLAMAAHVYRFDSAFQLERRFLITFKDD